MKPMHTGISLVTAALLLTLGLSGCSEDSGVTIETGATAESQTIDLEEANGGFLAVDEQAGFGDPELLLLATGEQPQEEGYQGLSPLRRAEAERLEQGRRRAIYSLTILWGDLEAPGVDMTWEALRLEGDPIEWQGSLTLDTGAIRLLSLLDFELEEDQILPREAKEVIAWSSVTHGFVDGVRLMITVPVDSTGQALTESIALELNDYARVFTVEELAELDELIELTPTEQISLRGFRIDQDVLVHGFCNGFWGRAPGDSVGVFRGAWVHDNGRLAGFMRGHYGVNAAGDRVFFGKYIGPSGRFGGFLRGTWDLAAPGNAEGAGSREEGHFQGLWVDRHGRAIGELGGHWGRQDGRPGIFNGAWRGRRMVPEV